MENSTLDLEKMHIAAEKACRLMKVLSNRDRLMLLCQLTGGERSVGELQPLVGLSQSALSQHLAVLRTDGLVATRRTGQTIYYRISNQPAAQLMSVLAAIFCPDDVEKVDD